MEESKMPINPECYIEIPADKLRDAVKLAFELSSPQGLGILHHRPGGLEDEAVDEIIGREGRGAIAASMDYVHGRSCKFHVYRGGEYDNWDDKLYIPASWYDHGDWALEQLLTRIGVEDAAGKIAAAQAAQEAENERWKRENAA
jgi:hypothetical protein